MIEQDTINTYCEATGVPLALLSDKGSVLQAAPGFMRNSLRPRFTTALIKEYAALANPEEPFIKVVGSGFYLGIMRLSPGVYLVVGPVATFRHAPEEAEAFLHEALGDPDSALGQEVLGSIPVVFFRRFARIFILAYRLLSGRKLPIEVVLRASSSEANLAESLQLLYAKQLVEYSDQEETYTSPNFEYGIQEAVTMGDMELARERLSEPVFGLVGKFSTDALRNEKYLFMALASQLTHAAIKGGVSAFETRNRLDTYCQKMDTFTHINEITDLAYHMVLDFTELVSTHQKRNYSLAVRNCMDYIARYRHEEIDLQRLSKATNMSVRTLSRKFKEEVGASPVEYIHEVKMKEAVYLLKYTTRSIAEISNTLSYSNQSYFSKIFSTTYGVPPKQFRNNLRLELGGAGY